MELFAVANSENDRDFRNSKLRKDQNGKQTRQGSEMIENEAKKSNLIKNPDRVTLAVSDNFLNMASHSRNWTYDDEDSDEKDSNEAVGRGSRAADNLGKSVEKFLYIANSQVDDDSDEDATGNVFRNIRVDEFKSEGKRMSKLVAFPSPGDLPPSDGSSDEEYEELGFQPNINRSLMFSESEDEGPTYVCDIYLPDPSTLVPALRGSCEKQGLAPKERRVSWSPEVYDPIPKEVSYAVKSKQKKQPKSEKKTGKEKQKGNKASSAKDKKHDKKQLRKNGGSSRRGQKSSEADYW